LKTCRNIRSNRKIKINLLFIRNWSRLKKLNNIWKLNFKENSVDVRSKDNGKKSNIIKGKKKEEKNKKAKEFSRSNKKTIQQIKYQNVS